MLKPKESNLVSRIRTYQRADKANKQCSNCGELGPVYICTDFHTFICTECSGLHRELSHKVKSITMSNWTVDEVDLLEKSGGNAHDRAVFLATHDPKIYTIPSSTSRDKLREFIRMKYVDKKWVDGVSTTSKASIQKTLPVEKESPRSITSNSPPSEVKKKEKPHVVKEVGWSDELVSFAPSVKATTPAEDIQAHFSKGIELLGRLKATNPVLAQQIVSSAINAMQQFISPSPPASPTVAPYNSCTVSVQSPQSPPRQTTTNPFDFLPPPSITIPPSVVVGTPVKSNGSSNPFDFFQ